MPQENTSDDVTMAQIMVDLVKSVKELNSSSGDLAKIVWKLNRIFMLMAISISTVLILSMVALSLYIIGHVRQVRDDVLAVSRKSDEIAKSVTVNQNVHVERGDKREDIIERHMLRHEEKKVDP